MALKIAIDLMHVPSQVRLIRAAPLPDDTLTLLRIVAGDEEAEREALALTGRPLQTIRRAAAFFVEQILFAPDADSYRILGAKPEAEPGELRRNVALLLRWLHPDLDSRGERSIFAARVTGAWNNLKTPERRAAYDALWQFRVSGRKSPSGRRSRRHLVALQRRNEHVRDIRWMSDAVKGGFLRRVFSALFSRPLQ